MNSITLGAIDIAIGAANIALYAWRPEWLHNLIAGVLAIAVGAAIMAGGERG